MLAELVLHGDLSETTPLQALGFRGPSVKHHVLSRHLPFPVTLHSRSKGFCRLPWDGAADRTAPPAETLAAELMGQLVEHPSGQVASASAAAAVWQPG